MRRHATAIASFIAIVASVAPQFAGAQTAAAATPPALKWGAAPPVFEPGAQMAVLQGDPRKAGEEFTVGFVSRTVTRSRRTRIPPRRTSP